MNRYAAIDHILWLKDRGVKEIYVYVNGQKYQVPTAHCGEGTTTLSEKGGPEDEYAVEQQLDRN